MNSSATPSSDPSTNVEQSTLDTLNRQQRRLNVLTIVAIALWTIAVVGSAAVLICYAIFYAPKEKKMLQDYGTAKWSQVSNHPVEPTPGSQPQTPEAVAGLQHLLLLRGIEDRVANENRSASHDGNRPQRDRDDGEDM